MSYRVNLHCVPQYKDVSDGLEAAAIAALTYHDVTAGEITIVLTGVNEIQDLNRKFAKCDEPTDVLSFVNNDPDRCADITYYGDVVIAVPIAEEQARNAGHSLKAELALLTIHGVLHLLDYDHENMNNRKRMWAVQASLLESLGYNIEPPEQKDD
jgi:probable rRNA maturation factor